MRSKKQKYTKFMTGSKSGTISYCKSMFQSMLGSKSGVGVRVKSWAYSCSESFSETGSK
jgi:hypothetical protein